MDILTVQKARKILKDAGIEWTWYMDLRNAELKEDRTEVRSAIFRMCTFLTQGI